MIVTVSDYNDFAPVVSVTGNPPVMLFSVSASSVTSAVAVYPERGIAVRFNGGTNQPAAPSFTAAFPAAVQADSATIGSLA